MMAKIGIPSLVAMIRIVFSIWLGISGSPQFEIWIVIEPICRRVVAIRLEVDTVRFLRATSVSEGSPVESTTYRLKHVDHSERDIEI